MQAERLRESSGDLFSLSERLKVCSTFVKPEECADDYQSNTAAEASMDDVSSVPGMGYDNLYLTSEVPRELESMSQDPGICENLHSKKPGDDEEVNIHQENCLENWIANDDKVKDESKFYDYESNDNMIIGKEWIDCKEETEEIKSSAEEDNFSAGDDKYSADDEDKYSTEEDIKYSAEDDDANFSIVEDRYSGKGKVMYTAEGECSYTEEEVDVKYHEAKLIEEQEDKYSADDIGDEWLGAGDHMGGQLEENNQQKWVRGNEEYIDRNVRWQSSSDVENTESEEDQVMRKKDQFCLPTAASSSLPKAATAQPMLCFNEYGNLTTCQSPEVNAVGQKRVKKKSKRKKSDIPTPLPTNDQNKVKSYSYFSDVCLGAPPCNGEVRTLRNRAKVSHDSVENAAVSEQELKQAFKEEFMTAATSRYGRTRKRKTEDGFFFGTLNFNELRKITSGSPKKSKGPSSKNSSPEQKTKHAIKEDIKQKPITSEGTDEVTPNGTVECEEGGLEGNTKCNMSAGRVQICETKDEMLVQNANAGQEDSCIKDVSNCIKTDDNSETEVVLKSDRASDISSGNDKFTEEEAYGNSKQTSYVQNENLTTKTETRESCDSTPVSPALSDRRRKLSLKRRSGLYSGTRITESHSIVSSDRLLRGRSDVSRIKRAVRENDHVEPHKLPRKTSTRIEHQSCVTNSTSTDSQDDDNDHQETLDSSGIVVSFRRKSRRYKANEDGLSSVTKSGRIIRKPQLMDISDEDKRQKLSREQLRLNEAQLNSSLDEELALSGVDMSTLEQENPCEYLVGDLVWVHIRGSPLWPALISYDLHGQYSKVSFSQNPYKVRCSRMYHVHFLIDKSLTHWIAPGNILPFEGFVQLREHLTELKSQLKGMKKCKRTHAEGLIKTLLHINKVSSGQKHERWIRAIEEAKSALPLDRYERLQKYTLGNIDVKVKEENEKIGKFLPQNLAVVRGNSLSFEAKPEKRKKGRPRKIPLVEFPVLKSLKSNSESTDGEFSGFDENFSYEDQQNDFDYISQSRKEGDFVKYAEKHLEALMLENPDITEKTARNKLRWKWKKMKNSHVTRYKFKFMHGDKFALKGSETNILKRKYYHSELDDDFQENEAMSAKRQRTEDEEDSIRGVYKVVRNEKVCYRCETVSNKAGADMIRCKGLCCGVFHLNCVGLSSVPKRDFKCNECQFRQHSCFLCKSFGVVQRCSVPFCGKYYHEECVQNWPQVFKQRQQERFVCPRHVCHMCSANADDMGDPVARNPPFTRCLRCPSTYHTGEDCIAAGVEEVSQNHHICTKHLELPKNSSHHVNVNWCFCCSKGGSLLLCDQCPAAFHADCMNITAPEGGYVCEDCENGKFPIYGDILWVKLGLYRWWPGQVLHPRFIPDNIENLPHQQGMFCVHFFGSNDYYWVTRGRAFLYQEGDKGSRAQSSKTLEKQFQRALEEAAEAYRAQKTKKLQREIRWSEKGNLKPPPYVRIDSNRPVGNVRLNKLDLAAVNRCDCDPNSDNPCGSDEKCLNRMLMFECVREVCSAGDRCGNQRFQKKQYPNVCSFKTEGRGWGLKTTQDVLKGEFVIEYVGELIDDEEFRRRIIDMHEVKEENFYFLTIDKDIMIDAGPKGNLARFMNHSCQPNCETQKWTVGGDTRVGLFAIEDIPAGSELTFNYNLQCVGTEKKRCCCGASNCSGFIGVKVQKTEVTGPKREKLGKQRRKRRRREAKMSEDECFRCGSPGDLILCDIAACPKGYHLECLGLDKLPKGKWICPWHHCDECGQRSTRLNRCNFCPNSFCRQHLQGNLRHLTGIGSVCQDHDSEGFETLRGQMETTAVTEDIFQMPKKQDNHVLLMPEKQKIENMANDSEQSYKCSVVTQPSSDLVLQSSDNSEENLTSNHIYGNSLESNSSNMEQEGTELHLAENKVNVLPLRMKRGRGRPKKLSSVGEGHENSSAVINVTGDGDVEKSHSKRIRHKRRYKTFLFHKKRSRKKKPTPENDAKHINES